MNKRVYESQINSIIISLFHIQKEIGELFETIRTDDIPEVAKAFIDRLEQKGQFDFNQSAEDLDILAILLDFER